MVAFNVEYVVERGQKTGDPTSWRLGSAYRTCFYPVYLVERCLRYQTFLLSMAP